MNDGKRDRLLFGCAAISLILEFIWGLKSEAEVPSATLNAITITIELGLVFALIVLGTRVLRSLAPDSGRAGWIFLLVTGILAALGILGTRLSGGPRVELSRPTSVGSVPAEGLPKQLHELILVSEKANEKAMAGPWVASMRKDPTLRTVSRQDIQNARAAYREVHETNSRILKLFAEAEAKGVDLSSASKTKVLTQSELWRVSQELSEAFDAKLQLIDQNWDEWTAYPSPAADSEMKPWQRELKRQDEIMVAATKQLNALINPSAAPSAPLKDAIVAAASATPTPRKFRETEELQKRMNSAPQNPAGPSPPRNDMDELVLKTHLLSAVGDYVQALARFQQTRWIKSPNANAYHSQKITRADLRDANEKLRDLITSVDKVIADLNAVTVPVPATEKEYWRVKREVSVLFQELTKLLEDNWQEWHGSGLQPRPASQNRGKKRRYGFRAKSTN